MEQMGKANAKLPESIIVNFFTYILSRKVYFIQECFFGLNLQFPLVQKAVAVLCSAKAGDPVCLIWFKLKLIVQGYLFA